MRYATVPVTPTALAGYYIAIDALAWTREWMMLPIAEAPRGRAAMEIDMLYGVMPVKPDRSSIENFIRSTMPPDRADELLAAEAATIESIMERINRWPGALPPELARGNAE